MEFLQKPLAWFSNFYLRVQSKICGRNNFFWSSFLNFFEVWAKIFQTFGQKTSRSFQNYILRVQRNSLWLEILRHGSQNSIYVSRVKISEETVFLFFFRNFFSDFERNFFQTSGEKSSKSCQNYLLRVQRNNLWLEIFFKSFESFWIFCRNLWHGSQIFIYVSRVIIAEETVFWFFFSELFRILRENFFRLSAKKRQEFVKTTFYVSRGTICGLNFLKFWIVSDFLQKPLAWFSNFYLRLQSKNCGRNSFLIFLCVFFSDFESKIFQIFGQKTSKSCQNYLLRVQRNSLWLEFFF